MKTLHKISVVPLPTVPLATQPVFDKKEGKVPMTPGVKEAPKGTCHLHFLLSPVLTKNCRKCHPSPGGPVSVCPSVWGSPSLQT